MTEKNDQLVHPPAHDHGPVPSLEWIVQGDQPTVTPHLRALAPTLTLDDQHFDLTELHHLDAAPPSVVGEIARAAEAVVREVRPVPGAVRARDQVQTVDQACSS